MSDTVSTVQNNVRGGVLAQFGTGRIMDSVASFNGTLEGDSDIVTLTMPTLVNTECGFSVDYSSGNPWGVRAGDEVP